MNAKTKVFSLLITAALLVTTTVFGTMAYLTDADDVVNTFTVGSVAIQLDEADVKLDGSYETNHDSRVKANDYKLIPGHNYIKDPTVTILKDSEKSYVRMLVTISNASALKEVFGAELPLETYVEGWDPTIWVANGITNDTDSNTITYEFRYKDTVTAPDSNVILDDLFESFTIPGTVTGEQLAKLKNTTITVVAHAIQADGFTDANTAWAEFNAK